eukprot:3550262-Lingulodinium_polyedra.AAC.1
MCCTTKRRKRLPLSGWPAPNFTPWQTSPPPALGSGLAPAPPLTTRATNTPTPSSNALPRGRPRRLCTSG